MVFELGPVSDLLGRERAIRIIRGVLEIEHGDGWGVGGADGLAVKILLALDHAEIK